MPNYKPSLNGVVIIDKPAGLTSHDVVNRVRRTLGERSVGHLGTLDPMATGVLPLVLGKFTRLAQFYTASEKTYEGTIRFGFATDTYDAEGKQVGAAVEPELSLPLLKQMAEKFVGVIEQTPPPYSAKKVDGVRAYKLARKEQPVELAPVAVEVKEFAILSVENRYAKFRAQVASGTYMRSIAHDMGAALGCGAHLAGLRRTSVREFSVAESHTIEQLQTIATTGNVEDVFIHPRKLLPEFPSVAVPDDIVNHIRCGRTVNLPETSTARFVKVFCGQRDLIAIASRVAGTLFHPKIVLLSA